LEKRTVNDGRERDSSGSGGREKGKAAAGAAAVQRDGADMGRSGAAPLREGRKPLGVEWASHGDGVGGWTEGQSS